MKKYLIFVFFPIIFAGVKPFNIQTKVIEGTGNSIDELMEPFKKIGENYYLIESNIKRTWLDAVHFCRTKDAHLASIETDDEWETLSSHLVTTGYTDQQWFWIAGNDIDTPLKFFWISSGQPMLFFKWSVGQPDNLGGNERCVHLWRKQNEFLMNDWGCHQQAHYICKANNPKKVITTIW